MKYCTKCGKELLDDAVICMGCGCMTDDCIAAGKGSDNALVKKLSEKIYTDAIIWLVIGALQILSGVFLIVGVLNILSAVNDMKYSKTVLEDPSGIVERYEPITMPIIVLAYNLVFGGLIGVIGSIYYFVAIRSFVMENKTEFEKLS